MVRHTYRDQGHKKDVIVNIEILGPTGQRLHVRLILTKNRTEALLSYETRTIQRAEAQGKSLEQVKAELIGDFSLQAIEEIRGSAWSLTDLLKCRPRS
ncbi:hypothetical protein ACU686_35520 [Yinghuangia aomiensis]